MGKTYSVLRTIYRYLMKYWLSLGHFSISIQQNCFQNTLKNIHPITLHRCLIVVTVMTKVTIRKQSFIETILQSLLFPEAVIQVYHYQPIFSKSQFTIAAMDNFHHSDFSSTTGTSGTHDTAMTLFQIKSESCCVKPLKSEINLKDINIIFLPCQQRENFS